MSGERSAIFFRPWLGLSGSDRWAVDAALALQAHGWQVEVWTNEQNRRAEFPKVREGRLAVHVAGGLPAWIFGGRLRVWRGIWQQRRLLRVLRRAGRKPELFVVDVLPHVVPAIRKVWPDAAVLVYCHYPDALPEPRPGSWYARYRAPVKRREFAGLRAADRVVANSEFTRAALRRVYPELAGREVPVVHPGVLRPESTPTPARERKWFLVVSRFDPRKGLMLALEAMERLRARLGADAFAECRVVFAGGRDRRLAEGEALVRAMRRRIAAMGLGDNVELRFNVPAEELERWWAGALALVHPTREEHFGIGLIEAMAHGVPVLAVNAGGPRETVVDGETGALRAPEPDAFAEVMAGWWRDPDRAAALGAAGRVRVEEHFTRERFNVAFAAEAERAWRRAARPRVAVLHPDFGPGGGGELVGAWFLQALAEDHALTLVCCDEPDWAAVDERFGTHLAGAGIAVRVPGALGRILRRCWRWSGGTLRMALTEGRAARLAREEPVDLWVSTCNELRLPQAGLRYVHYPLAAEVPAGVGLDRFRRQRTVRRLYRALCEWIAGPDRIDPARQVTLVNSRFTAAVWARSVGTPAKIVYPPVPPLGGDRPGEPRAERVLCLGRLLAGKGLQRVARIVGAARDRGADLRLVFAGAWACRPDERRELEAFFRRHDWIEVVAGPTRAEVAALVRSSRYGLHGMTGEPFGIAVAEMMEGGAITFAPADSGAAEILDDERLLYRDEADAVEKLLRVWRDGELREELRAQAAARAGRFAPERFVQAVRAAVADQLSARAAARKA